jgi:hypothetical protein
MPEARELEPMLRLANIRRLVEGHHPCERRRCGIAKESGGSAGGGALAPSGADRHGSRLHRRSVGTCPFAKEKKARIAAEPTPGVRAVGVNIIVQPRDPAGSEASTVDLRDIP